ncbi:type VI secretion system-associated protein TagF [Thiohalocapsa marina]|uniref:Type VI secretion system-associated protein TagF n=1 Tax=Thiohalocapsa marina TaxID=424902 RepID=A0A5M8FU82_9GAMM|nr:type VI secretion system-associated protein TagF [Thiohalocapsa marina]KAA6187360.1 type VI secretion system-associated protein TagF [Thiohalocapsa marina]
MPGQAVTAEQIAAGLFGKLPGQGDFITRRLPQAFLRVWDPWLQSCLNQSREALGDAWLDAYLTSPIWRFVLTAGIAGQTPWCGLLMPSVDRVGRYFPLTVACALPQGTNPFLALSSGHEWLDSAQSLMLDALEGALSLEELDTGLMQLSSLPGTPAPSTQTVSPAPLEPRGWRLGLSESRYMPHATFAFLHLALQELFLSYSLWWSAGSERVAPSLLLCQGLPVEQAFPALYTGDWGAGQWWNLGDPITDAGLGEPA